jgi:hypothetical protein
MSKCNQMVGLPNTLLYWAMLGDVKLPAEKDRNRLMYHSLPLALARSYWTDISSLIAIFDKILKSGWCI